MINLIGFVLVFLHSSFTGLDQCLPQFLPVKHTLNLSADTYICSKHPETVGVFSTVKKYSGGSALWP